MVNMVPLHLVYEQASGRLLVATDQDGRTPICRGYSGYGSGFNDPNAQALRSIGPIPRGVWRVEYAGYHPRLGPACFRLHPVGHEAFGRTEFFIHGDNADGNGTASTGCIIAPRPAREAIRALGILALEVVL